MEDYALDVMIGKGPSARSLRLTLRPFTIVGATTRAGRISGPAARPLRGRLPARLLRRRGPRGDRPPLGRHPRHRGHRRAAAAHRRRAAGPRRGSSTGSSSASGTTPRSTATAGSTLRRGRRGDGRPRDRRDGPRRDGPPAARRDHPEVRRRAGRRRRAGARSSPRRSRRSRTSTSRTCCGSASWTGRRRGAWPRTAPGRTSSASATTCRRGARTASRPCGRPAPGPDRARRTGRAPDGRARARRRRRDARRHPRPAGGLSRPCRAPPASRSSSRRPPTARRARASGRLRPAARGRGDADVHAGRARTPRSRRSTRTTSRRSAPRSSWPTPTTSTCGPGTSGSRGSAASTAFMSWDRPILTDSGGFQVVSLGDLNAIDDDGVTFRSHHDGSRHRFTPETLDRRSRRRSAPTWRSPSTSRSRRRRPIRATSAIATERTHRWAVRSLEAHRRTGPGALRGHPGRPGPRPAAALHGVHRRASRSTASTSAASPATRRRPSATAVLDLVVPLLAGRSARPLPDGPRLARSTCSRRSTAASTCSTRCCRRGSPATASSGSRAAGSTSATSASATIRAPIQEGCRLPGLPALLAGLPRPPVPGRRAARVPARDLSQPHLHPRLHGRDPGRAARRDLPSAPSGAARAGAPAEPR